MAERVGVTAIVTFPEAFHDEAVALFQKHLPMLRAYPGCQRFVVYQDVEKRGVFTINEEWETQESLTRHLKDEAVISIFSQIELLQGKIKNIFTQEITSP